MSHTVFHAAQIMPVPTTKALSSKSLLPPPRAAVYRSLPAVPCKLLRKGLVVKASSSVVDGDAVAGLERCLRASPSSDLPAASSSSKEVYGPVMKGGQYGAFGATTLEKSKLDLSQKQTKSSPETAIGGGGGDIGKSINFGGGDGGDDNGDDDDYFDDFDEGDDGDEGGLFRRRIVLQELFDRKFIDAVLNEWQKTMMDLPAGLRQAYEMGLVSSAQMAKYLAINARPTTARIISRKLPQGLSRAFIGRMIADPAFLYKLLLEQASTIGCSVWWELKTRKERLSMTIPSVSTNALGYGAFLGLYANLRYQLLCGFDHAMVYHFDVIGVALLFSTTLRLLNVQLGETSRLAWLGVEVDPLAQSENLLKAYSRPTEAVDQPSSSKWFISKNSIVSGLGLLGIKQGQSDTLPEGEVAPPKARRKRVVRKKVSTTQA